MEEFETEEGVVPMPKFDAPDDPQDTPQVEPEYKDNPDLVR